MKNVILVTALLVLNNTQECQARGYYTQGDLHGSLVAIFGKVYNMTDYNNEREPILFLAKDSSRIFPRTPISRLPTLCLDVTKGDYLSVHQYPRCLELNASDKINGATCHNRPIGTQKAHAYFKPYEIGELVIPETELEANGRQWIAIDATVYDVTQYLGGLRDETGQINKDPYHPNAYLHASLHSLIVDNVNTDASKVYEERFDGMSHML